MDKDHETKLLRVRAAFVALIEEEIRVHGGVVEHAGRCGEEQNELRAAVSDLVGVRIAVEASNGSL